MSYQSAATAEITGFPTRLFPSGSLDLPDGSQYPIPSRDAANAVDFIYHAENCFRSNIARIVAGGDVDLSTTCKIANLAYVILAQDEDVRTRLTNSLDNNGNLTFDEIDSVGRRDASRFITTDGFRHLMAKAACGVDNGQHTSELANLIVVLAESDRMIASDITRAATSFH